MEQFKMKIIGKNIRSFKHVLNLQGSNRYMEFKRNDRKSIHFWKCI